MIVSGIIFLLISVVASAQQTHHKQQFSTDYLLYLPDNYGADTTKHPLVIFLHGSGERGSDVNLVTVHGIPMKIKNGESMPFIALSPQCPAGYSWDIMILNNLLDSVMANYRVDPDRVYLSGISMGGYASWAWAIQNPERFAAMIPVCGGGNPQLAWRIRNIPTWAFHGEIDDTVPMTASVEMIDALNDIGANPKFTVYPGVKHESWKKTFEDPAVYEWMLSQKRQDKTDNKLSDSDLSKYIGKYLTESRDTITISNSNGMLQMATSNDKATSTLTADGPNRFYSGEWWHNMVIFRQADSCIYGVEIYGKGKKAINGLKM